MVSFGNSRRRKATRPVISQPLETSNSLGIPRAPTDSPAAPCRYHSPDDIKAQHNLMQPQGDEAFQRPQPKKGHKRHMPTFLQPRNAVDSKPEGVTSREDRTSIREVLHGCKPNCVNEPCSRCGGPVKPSTEPPRKKEEPKPDVDNPPKRTFPYGPQLPPDQMQEFLESSSIMRRYEHKPPQKRDGKIVYNIANGFYPNRRYVNVGL